MSGPEKFQAFTYKDNRDTSKSLSKKDSVVSVKEENLVEMDDKYTPSNSMDAFKYSSAKQNEWVRALFQQTKNIEEVYREIEEFTLKEKGFEYNKQTREYIDTRTKDVFGIESPQIRNIINSSDAWTLKIGVKSAFECACYIDKNSKEGDRLFTNDTLDSVNKIDFVGTDVDGEGYLNEVNLIQVKSSKPLTEKELMELKREGRVPSELLKGDMIESIKNKHKDYIKNIDKITQDKILDLFESKWMEERDSIFEKYGNGVFDLLMYLSDVDKEVKEKKGIDIIDEIIKENDISLVEKGWTYFALLMSDEYKFNDHIKDICNSDINTLDTGIFQKWLNRKINMQDPEIKKSIYREYKPHNIISGRKFNSVIYYKENGGWGKMVINLD